MKESEIIEYINVATYDKEGAIIWASKDGNVNWLLDVRGFGHLQNLFGNEYEATKAQDDIGQFIVDAINEHIQDSEQSKKKGIGDDYYNLIPVYKGLFMSQIDQDDTNELVRDSFHIADALIAANQKEG